MAKTYRLSLGVRLINSVFRLMTRLGLGASYRYVLTVPGRTTGRLYSTPVDVIEAEGDRWLVAAYGPSSWARNTRAAGEVTLSRGGGLRSSGSSSQTRRRQSRRSEPISTKSK
jgi:deazaflavin-dependent oxidoreductase (nitroreductase family)